MRILTYIGGLAPMLQAFLFPRVALRNRDLLRSFVWRDLAARYEGSVLGRLLPVVYPVLLLALYHLVFAEFLNLKMLGKSPLVGGGWGTTFYLLSGILPWLFVADCMARSTPVILDNANLIKKIAFPSELLPTFVAVAQLVHFLISLVLFIGMALVVNLSGLSGAADEDRLRLCVNMLYLPIPIMLQLLFCVGLSMLLSTINVFVRDLSQVVSVLILLWMLVSPIFYPVSMVAKSAAEKDQMWMLTVMKLNPMYHMLVMYRSCFPSSAEDLPFPWISAAVFAGVSLLLFVVGHALFIRLKGLFPDEV